MSRHGFHSFTSSAPVFGEDESFDPFYEVEVGRLPSLRSGTALAPLRGQAASRLEQSRSSHGAGSKV